MFLYLMKLGTQVQSVPDAMPHLNNDYSPPERLLEDSRWDPPKLLEIQQYTASGN